MLIGLSLTVFELSRFDVWPHSRTQRAIPPPPPPTETRNCI